MKGKKKQSKKKNTSIKDNKVFIHFVMIFLVILLIAIGVAFSYAFWTSTESQISNNQVQAGCLSFTFNDKDVDGNVTSISMLNTYPMSDTKGLTTKPYTFSITNTCTLTANYDIFINTLSTSTLDSKYIKYALSSTDSSVSLGPDFINDLSVPEMDANINDELIEKIGEIKSSHLVDSVILSEGKTITFNMRLWIDYDAPNEIMGQSFNSAISVISTAAD